jgi:hypothetical protein
MIKDNLEVGPGVGPCLGETDVRRSVPWVQAANGRHTRTDKSICAVWHAPSAVATQRSLSPHGRTHRSLHLVAIEDIRAAIVYMLAVCEYE